jgi:hypothetical protein
MVRCEVFTNQALYHVRVADATILGSRYVARWAPATKTQAACIAADHLLARWQRITQPRVQVALLITDGLSKTHRHGIAVEDLFSARRTTPDE